MASTGAGRIAPRELSDDEVRALDLPATHCTGCTPCCTAHAHFLHEGKVLWACQHKLRRKREERPGAQAEGEAPSGPQR